MKVKSIEKPASDEQVLAVYPKLAPNVAAGWRKRLNFYSGRSLSDVALITEQENRAGRLALRGQLLSPGVISGLEVGLAMAGGSANYYISAGFGLAASGEDVYVARDWQVAYDQIPVYAPAPFFEGGVAGSDSDWEMGGTLAEIRTEGLDITAAILVLQPVTISQVGEFDPLDPCAVNPDDDAFADWTVVDGCRLVYHLWPEQLLPMPVPGDRWRNRLAYTIFQYEQQLGLDDLPPWMALGVPVGLVGMDSATGLPLFVDSHAVVRGGGKPKQRTPLAPGAGSLFHWQARMQQAAEHMAELIVNNASIQEIAAEFRYMPPAGLLPRDAAAPREQEGYFFPPNYVVDAVPVPLEQLDLALESSAGLEVYDMDVADQLRLLVPVPQIWYEPDLLEVMTVDPEFQEAIDDYVLDRSNWLARRADVREKVSLLIEAITGNPVKYADPDPGALEPGETPATDLSETFSGTVSPPNSPTHTIHALAGQELHIVLSTGSGNPNFTVTGLQDGQPLKRIVNEDRDWRGTVIIEQDYQIVIVAVPGSPSEDYTLSVTVGESAFGISENAPDEMEIDVVTELKNFILTTKLSESSVSIRGATPFEFPAELEGKARFNDATTPTRLFWLGNMSEAQRDILVGLLPQHTEQVGNLFNKATALEVSRLDQDGLEAFIRFLQQKVNRVDDEIDFGFVRAQTDIYRVRNLMLDDLSATRLATSPALASIAQGKSAVATRENIQAYVSQLRNGGTQPPTEPLEEGPDDGGGPTPLAESAPTLTNTMGAANIGGSMFISSELSGGRSTLFTPTIGIGNVAQPTGGFNISIANPITGIGGIGEVSPIFPSSPVVGGNIPIAPLPDRGGGETGFTPAIITGQSPIVGKAYNFRTMTIAERLERESSNETKEASASNMYETMNRLSELDMYIDDIQVPGIAVFDANNEPVITRGHPERITMNFADLMELGLGRILLDPEPEDADESVFFSSTLAIMEGVIGTLRQFEGRVASYKKVIERCQETLAQVRRLAAAADQRLKVIGDELAEARHDVSVARALLAEETRRVNAINERRDKILNEQVTFLAYHRPRTAEIRKDAPGRTLYPALREEAVPACLEEHEVVPGSLQKFVELWRDVPLKWLKYARPLVKRLDNLQAIQQTLIQATKRAVTTAALPVQTPVTSQGRLGLALSAVINAGQQKTQNFRLQATQMSVTQIGAFNWQSASKQAEEVASLDDLIGAGNGRSDVARRAARELDNIAQVATCLYHRFAAVKPVIRLEWAERLSQFDQAVDLRNLGNLSRWGEIDYLERRDMQALADWLYGRIEVAEAEALAMMNDLVRVCILLASHAPVNEIIAGRVEEPVVVKPGGRVKLAVNPTLVRVGMPVLMYRGQEIVAQGVVEDLSAAGAAARVTNAKGETESLDTNTRVQFVKNATMIAGMGQWAGK